jgi:hypothetical protein
MAKFARSSFHVEHHLVSVEGVGYGFATVRAVPLNLLLGALVIVVASAIGMGAMLFVRRSAPEGGYFNDGDRAAGIFGVLAGGFAILLGFIVFLAFASYDESRSGAEVESLKVVEQYQTAQLFEDEAALAFTGQLICYGRFVVYQEWPEMQDGDLGNSVNPWSVALFNTLLTVQPDGPAQESAFDSWLGQTSERQEARQDRIHGAEGIMPWPLWLVLIGVAAIIFGFTLMFADSAERWWVQAAQIGTVVAVTTATMLVIVLLNVPFQDGVGGLEPIAMERALETLDSVKDVGVHGEPPCSATGEAL